MSDLATVELVHAPTGTAKTIDDHTTLFDLVLLVVDANNPHLTSRILDVYARIDRVLGDADVNLDIVVVGASGARATEIAGEFAARGRPFEDPDGKVALQLGVTQAPTLLWINPACEVQARTEGWVPDQWRPIVADLARHLAWTRPLVPDRGDPAPFAAMPFQPPLDEADDTEAPRQHRGR